MDNTEAFKRTYRHTANLDERANLLRRLIATHEKETGEHLVLLGMAIDYEDYDLVAHLLKTGVDVNETNYMGQCAIHNAVVNDNVELVKRLLVAGARLDLPYDNPLVTACEGRMISESVGDKSQGVKFGDDAHGNLEMVKLLVEHGARVNEPKGRLSPLQATNDPIIIKYLIVKGADPVPVMWKLRELGVTNFPAVKLNPLPSPAPPLRSPPSSVPLPLGTRKGNTDKEPSEL